MNQPTALLTTGIFLLSPQQMDGELVPADIRRLVRLGKFPELRYTPTDDPDLMVQWEAASERFYELVLREQEDWNREQGRLTDREVDAQATRIWEQLRDFRQESEALPESERPDTPSMDYARQEVAQLLADPTTAPFVRQELELIQQQTTAFSDVERYLQLAANVSDLQLLDRVIRARATTPAFTYDAAQAEAIARSRRIRILHLSRQRERLAA